MAWKARLHPVHTPSLTDTGKNSQMGAGLGATQSPVQRRAEEVWQPLHIFSYAQALLQLAGCLLSSAM